MKTVALFVLTVGGMALALPAQERALQINAAPRSQTLDWQDPKWWQRDWNRDELKFSLGKSDYAVSGPFVETFRSRRTTLPDPGLGQRILNLPIINLFVPQPMPKPPGGEGKYLAWGQKDLPWSAVAARPTGEPVGLVSVNW